MSESNLNKIPDLTVPGPILFPKIVAQTLKEHTAVIQTNWTTGLLSFAGNHTSSTTLTGTNASWHAISDHSAEQPLHTLTYQDLAKMREEILCYGTWWPSRHDEPIYVGI